MDGYYDKLIHTIPSLAGVPDYDILAPVMTATREELENGLAVPVSVCLKGRMDNLIYSNFAMIDSESALTMDEAEIEKLNSRTDELIKNAVSEDIEIITRGSMVSSGGQTEVRYCEDTSSDGIPDSKSLTVISFGESSPGTVFLVRSTTKDWREFIKKMSEIKSEEAFREFLKYLLISGDGGNGSDDEPDFSELADIGEDGTDGELFDEIDTALVFSDTIPKSRVCFGTKSLIPSRIFPGGGPAGFTLTTVSFENGVRFPEGGVMKMRYSIDSSGMTQQRADLTITVKPIAPEQEK